MFPGWNPMQQAYFQPQFQAMPMQPVAFNWANPGMSPQPPMPDAVGGVPATVNPPPPGEEKPPLPPEPPPSEEEKPKKV